MPSKRCDRIFGYNYLQLYRGMVVIHMMDLSRCGYSATCKNNALCKQLKKHCDVGLPYGKFDPLTDEQIEDIEAFFAKKELGIIK